MNRAASIALLVLGIALLLMGADAYRSVESSLSHFITGAPSNRALLLLVGGAAAAIAGLRGLTR